jgi:hypothetical protein
VQVPRCMESEVCVSDSGRRLRGVAGAQAVLPPARHDAHLARKHVEHLVLVVFHVQGRRVPERSAGTGGSWEPDFLRVRTSGEPDPSR